MARSALFGDMRGGLVLIFLLIEMVGTRAFGLSFPGFALRQYSKMPSYNPVLLEPVRTYSGKLTVK